MKNFVLIILFLFLTPLLLGAQGVQENVSTSTSESGEGEESVIEEGKELAEKFIVEPAKVVGETVALNAGPIIDRITRLLESKKEEVEEKIAKDKEVGEILKIPEEGEEKKRFSERLRDEAPSLLRVLYSWLLSLMIIIFNVWWLLALVVLALIRVAWKLFRRWRDGY